MADRKISDLTALTTPASDDFLPIVDISEAEAASKNKRITLTDLFNTPAFTQSGAGAVSRTVDAKLKDILNVKDFGAVGDGATDDTAAIQAAINFAASIPFAGAEITFTKSSIYRFTSLVFPASTAGSTNGGVILNGNGCILLKTSTTSTGIVIQGAVGDRAERRQGSGIKNMRFGVTATQTAGAMIQVQNANHTILESLDIESAYIGIVVMDTFCTRIDKCYIRNSQLRDIYVVGTSGLSTVETFITNTVGEGLVGNVTKTGLLIDSGVTGLFVTNCDWIHGTVGVALVHSAQGDNPAFRPEWLFFSSVLSDTIQNTGWNIAGNVDGLFLNKCWAATCGQTGFAFNFGAIILVTDCVAINNGQHGLSISGTATEVRVKGGVYACNSTSASAIFNGIRIEPNVSNFSVSGARCGNIPSLSLPGVQSAGIYVNSGASDNYQLIGNNCNNSSGSPITDLGTGVSKKISDNLGFNPVGYVNIALPASLTAYTNNTGTDATVYVSGGTVTGMEINFKGTGFVSTGLTSGAVSVPANTAIRLTYSVAPSWIWFFN